MVNLGNMMKQAQQLQKKMSEAQEKLNSIEVEGVSGGGMVKVVVSGKKILISIDVNPELMKEDKEMLEDLILVATNNAIEKVDNISKEKMASITGGMNVPGLF